MHIHKKAVCPDSLHEIIPAHGEQSAECPQKRGEFAMKRLLAKTGMICTVVGLAVGSAGVQAQIAKNVAAKSPWGPADEIGTLNMMTDASRFEVLKQVAGGKVYDLGVDLFVGMPNCCGPFGDPTFQIRITHIPEQDTAKELLSYSGDGISMYTHSGTHLDTLN